jgi:hypothetical protein
MELELAEALATFGRAWRFVGERTLTEGGADIAGAASKPDASRPIT